MSEFSTTIADNFDEQIPSTPWKTGGDERAVNNNWISNDEATAILRNSISGLKPNLSRLFYRFVKRSFDILASSIAITILIIPSLALCAAICIKSPGAGPLYSQWRVGRLRKDGSFDLFRMWKFRSMVPEADKRLKELRDLNEADGPLFKMRKDPRVIEGVGTFIRKHSIDELPQLINVLFGKMSLIGPRPALPCEVVQYDIHAMRRLTVKCGCGGAWQASTRSDSSFEEMVELDLDYIERSSIGYDLYLAFSTVRAMLFGKGAY